MSRVAVHVTTLTGNAFTADPTGTTCDASNDHSIDPGGPSEEIIIRIKQTDGSARVATLKAGTFPPALDEGQGDVTQSMAQNEVWFIGPIQSGRFMQSNGLIYIDLAASFAGTIEAFKIPRNV